MIFQFPDLDTFRLAVTSAQVPPEVSAAPAEVSFDPEGRPSVRSASGIPPKPMQNALRKLGVKSVKEHYSETVLSVDCWPQILPVEKLVGAPEVTSNTPVLFEMPLSEMPAVVSEMLRLGNDRQSFRTLAATEGQSERVLLRAIGPPYYTLLRAIDKSTQKCATITAYLEKSPRVWVEIGHDHPLAGRIKPAEGQVLLLRPEREWSIVQDGPFQDVYEVLDFKLPTTSVEWKESHLKGKLAVSLRLVPGNAADVAEMWVLTENAVDQLDAFVRDADERLMARLLFAVIEDGERKSIILKTRPSKLSPPVLSIEKAQGFKPFWKLPNLFVPLGSRLMPTLRRDAVRKLLAEDPAQVVWLMPKEDGKFTPEYLPDDAFRPLEDWIEYIIDHEHQALQSWMQATRFDFDSFECSEEQPDKPKGPPAEKGKKNKKRSKDVAEGDLDLAPVANKGNKPKAPTPEEIDFQIPSEVLPPNEVKARLRELEKEFLEHPGSLDSNDRQAIWPEMARLNALDGRELEAAICWTNAFWELPEVPPEGAWNWLKSEDRHALPTPGAEDFDTVLESKHPSPSEARVLVARVVHASLLSPLPAVLVKRLPRIRDYLEKYESSLGTRAVWLVWRQLARVSSDSLVLARVRDRLLLRLLAEGLNKERDLPYFLRVAGEHNSDRLRQVRDRAMKVHTLVEKWHERDSSTKKSELETTTPAAVNRPYIDLLFSFTMAKLGEVTAARDLMHAAKNRFMERANAEGKMHPVHQFLFDAFSWRIENAIQGKPHSGSLPLALWGRVDQVEATVNKMRGNTGANARYVIERMIHDSWVLEPQRGADPYAKNQAIGTSLITQLGEIVRERNGEKVSNALLQLLRSKLSDDDRLRVVMTGMGLAARVGEGFASQLLKLVQPVIRATMDANGPREHASHRAEFHRKLLKSSLFVAAHFDFEDHVKTVFALLIARLESESADERYRTISDVSAELVRVLRKLGLRDEINLYLSKSSELILRDRPLKTIRQEAGTKWPEVLMTLLSIAEAWLVFGAAEKAAAYLEEARKTLFEPKQNGLEFEKSFLNVTKLVRAYVGVLVHLPLEEALFRIEELFTKLGRLPNTTTTSEYFSRLHLNIVEDVIRTLINDSMLLGDQARRWLDDDEYLVRRRIHADMKRVLTQSGLN